MSDLLWTTRDGRKLRLRDMEPNHIENCLKMIYRAHRRKLLAESLGAMRYASTAPDGASMCAEEASCELMDMVYNNEALQADAAQRYELVREMLTALKGKA